ncbi:hypothetical protein KUV57_24800 [Epibacterium sp. DP7N7-1]|nr:hypothetical protein [Epibacterium sp. DP7N7-1]
MVDRLRFVLLICLASLTPTIVSGQDASAHLWNGRWSGGVTSENALPSGLFVDVEIYGTYGLLEINTYMHTGAPPCKAVFKFPSNGEGVVDAVPRGPADPKSICSGGFAIEATGFTDRGDLSLSVRIGNATRTGVLTRAVQFAVPEAKLPRPPQDVSILGLRLGMPFAAAADILTKEDMVEVDQWTPPLNPTELSHLCFEEEKNGILGFGEEDRFCKAIEALGDFVTYHVFLGDTLRGKPWNQEHHAALEGTARDIDEGFDRILIVEAGGIVVALGRRVLVDSARSEDLLFDLQAKYGFSRGAPEYGNRQGAQYDASGKLMDHDAVRDERQNRKGSDPAFFQKDQWRCIDAVVPREYGIDTDQLSSGEYLWSYVPEQTGFMQENCGVYVAYWFEEKTDKSALLSVTISSPAYVTRGYFNAGLLNAIDMQLKDYFGSLQMNEAPAGMKNQTKL